MLEAGAPDGRPVLVHNGTPNSRLLYEPTVRLAENQGIRMIGYDRPGYGGSDRDPGRTVAGCAGDVRAICRRARNRAARRCGASQAAGRTRSHARRCCPTWFTAVAVLASIAPWGAEGLDYFEGMGSENIEARSSAASRQSRGRAKQEPDAWRVLAATRQTIYTTIETLLSPVDGGGAHRRRLTQYLYDVDAASGLAPGADGWWDDDVAFAEPWGIRASSTSGLPFYCCTDARIGSFRSATASGLPRHIPGVEAAAARTTTVISH